MVMAAKSLWNYFDTRYRDFNKPLSAFANNHFVYINKAYCDLLGWESHDLIGKDVYKVLLHVDDPSKDVWTGQCRAKNGDIFNFEGVVQVDENADFMHEVCVGIVTNCTLSHHVRLQDVEPFFHVMRDMKPVIMSGFNDTLILDELPIGITVIVEDSYHWVYVNKYYAENLGYRPRDFLLGNVKMEESLVDMTKHKTNVLPFNRDLQFGGNRVIHYSKTYRHKTGRHIDARLMTSRFQLPDQNLTYLLSIVDFRQSRDFHMAQTPAAVKRCAELLREQGHNITNEQVLEVSNTLVRENFMDWKQK